MFHSHQYCQRVAHHRRPVQGNTGGKINRQTAVVFTQAAKLPAHQVFQKVELGFRQGDGLAGSRNNAGRGIDLDISNAQS